MLKNIQKMKSFGIFDDYTKPVDIKDFSDRNIIYGWNYSGKTTIARLFGMLESKKLHDDFLDAKFELTDHDGASVTDETVVSCNKAVRVFDLDFIKNNIKWDGESFNPILLLGGDAIDAETKIDVYEKLVKRSNESATKKRNAITEIDKTVSDGKTHMAKQIKQNLGIVEAFTATHLGNLLMGISVDDTNYTLIEEQFKTDLKLATTAEKDKLVPIAEVVVSPTANILYTQASILLPKTPGVSQVIEYLKNHPEVSKWVEIGLPLHGEKTNCEFCGNTVSAERLAQLRAHFSQDVINNKLELQDLIQQASTVKLQRIDLRASEFNTQFRERLAPILTQANNAVRAYNNWLDSLVKLLNTKLESQFVPLASPSDPKILQDSLIEELSALNELIRENNRISENFATEKSKAISRLKNHYAEQFQIDYKIEEGEKLKHNLKIHAERYEKAVEQARLKIKELYATINRAQKGGEKINARISNLLGSDSIQITVIKNNEGDRFQLTRLGKIAKNLSEGEKTTIAFAFFLTKLEEAQKLKDVIVYIDDPISSLDSNHIFQVFSIIKNSFFHQSAKENGKLEWNTTCKQLFISTHNFEFFALLRQLPGNDNNPLRYFFAKRVSASRSIFTNMPPSILKYSSEYHYLFSVIHKYHESEDKANIELLLPIPNAVRRFLELYTFAKVPLFKGSSVDQRAEILFGTEKSLRVLKLLHHFSHLSNIERIAVNTDLISDIETVVNEIIEHIKTDKMHYDALMESLT